MYRLLTKGSVEAGDAALPPAFSPSDTWVPQLKTPMRSAYAEVHGAEPEFTDYTRNDKSGEFSGTLDYVFLSPGVQAQCMDALPKLADAVPSPSELVPSDHWPLAGTLVVECK